MATFNILIDGKTSTNTLIFDKNSESVGTCNTVFDCSLGALNGDDINLTFTYTGSGTYDIQMDEDDGNGYVNIDLLQYSLIFNSYAHLRVIIYNDTTTDELTVELTGENTTENVFSEYTVTRTSTGTIC